MTQHGVVGAGTPSALQLGNRPKPAAGRRPVECRRWCSRSQRASPRAAARQPAGAGCRTAARRWCCRSQPPARPRPAPDEKQSKSVVDGVTETDCSCTATVISSNSEQGKFESNQFGRQATQVRGGATHSTRLSISDDGVVEASELSTPALPILLSPAASCLGHARTRTGPRATRGC